MVDGLSICTLAITKGPVPSNDGAIGICGRRAVKSAVVPGAVIGEGGSRWNVRWCRDHNGHGIGSGCPLVVGDRQCDCVTANSKGNTCRGAGGYLHAPFRPDKGDNRAAVGIIAIGTIKGNRLRAVTVRIANALISSGIRNRGLVHGDRNDLIGRVTASISIIDSEHHSVSASIRVGITGIADRQPRIAVAVTKVPGICERVAVRVV